MGNAATIQLKGENKQLQDTLDESEKNVTNFGDSFKKVMIGIGAAIAAVKIVGFAKDLVAAYGVQEEAERALESQLKRTGDTVGYTSDQLKTMASRLQGVTNVGDETILGAQKLIATFDNIRGDRFREVTELSLDLSKALGVDLNNAAATLGRAMQNPIEGMRALKSAGVEFTGEQKALIKSLVESGDVLGAQQVIIDEVTRLYGGEAANATKTFASAQAGLWGRVGDLKEQGGKLITTFLLPIQPVLDDVLTLIENLTARFMSSTEGAQNMAKESQSSLSGLVEYIVGNVIVSINLALAAWDSLGDAWELGTKTMKLGTIAAQEDAQHLFGVVLPELLGWLQRNWPEVLQDIANFTKTAFENMLKNGENFIKAFIDMLRGKGFNFEFTALTEGFESSLKELPNITKRHITATEHELAQDIESISKRIGDRFNEALLSGDKTTRDLLTKAQLDEGKATESDKPFRQLGIKPPKSAEELALEARIKQQEEDLKSAKTAQDAIKGQIDVAKENAPEKTLAGGFEDLVAMNRRIASAAAASPEDRRHKEQLKQLEQLVKQQDALIKTIQEGISVDRDTLKAIQKLPDDIELDTTATLG